MVLDIDPQGNTTSGLGVAKKGLKDTVYNVLVDVDYDIRDAVIHTGVEKPFGTGTFTIFARAFSLPQKGYKYS